MENLNRKFILAIDSSCDISIDYCEKNEVYPLFMQYTIEDEVFTDTMNENDFKEFYDKMRNGSVSKTGAINSYRFLEFFEKLVEQNLPIVYLCLSSGLSVSYNNALQARDEFLEKYPDKELYVVDSLMASSGIALLLSDAVKMRDEGKTAKEVSDWLTENVLNVSVFYTTNEMVYLYRGGRVKKFKYIVSDILKINPILKVNPEGKLVVHQAVPGEKKAFKRFIELVEKNVVNPENQVLFVSHSDCKEKAIKFGETLKENLKFKDVVYSGIGTTIGSHTGPGLVAVFFYGKERLEESNK